jgi:hypothetical protein
MHELVADSFEISEGPPPAFTVVVSITMHGVEPELLSRDRLKRLESSLTTLADGWREQEPRNAMHAQVYVGVQTL